MIRDFDGRKVFVMVPSYKRAANVPSIHALLGRDVTWIVWAEQEEEYRKMGALNILYQKNLSDGRNVGMDEAFKLGVPILISDDDAKSFGRLQDGKRVPISFEETVIEMYDAAVENGAKLAGVLSTPNPFYASNKVNTTGFCCGCFLLIFPNDLRFDHDMEPKEDYHYTLGQLATVGKVARCDFLLPIYEHWTNDGGVKETRTPESEIAAIQKLKAIWGVAVRDNPRRENEILLHWDAEKYHASKRKNRKWGV